MEKALLLDYQQLLNVKPVSVTHSSCCSPSQEKSALSLRMQRVTD